jgi:hypothetical protein
MRFDVIHFGEVEFNLSVLMVSKFQKIFFFSSNLYSKNTNERYFFPSFRKFADRLGQKFVNIWFNEVFKEKKFQNLPTFINFFYQ